MAGEKLYTCRSCRTDFALKRLEQTIHKKCPTCGRTAHVKIET